jgi:hypothetical protein
VAKLPTLTFYRSPAPTAAAKKRPDTVYDVHSTKTLVNEFQKREAQIRGLK